MNYSIVVLVSASTEWKVVRSFYPDCTIEETPYGEMFSQDNLLFLHGGIGKISAAASTQFCIDRFSPQLIINLGTCGGFIGEVDKGDIVLATGTIVYDIIDQMGPADATINYYSTELDLSFLTKPYPQKVISNVIVSGDRDLLSEDIPNLKKRWGAVAGDWESGSIAWVCKRNNINCLILRGVSDLVGKSGGEAYEDFSVFEEGAKLVMTKLLNKLPQWISQSKTQSATTQIKVNAPLSQ